MPRVFPNVTADAALAAIVGAEPMPRHEVTKRVWDYIRAHNLQDAKNRRAVNADHTLRAIFPAGKEQVSMFELPKCISRHVTGNG